jgi:mono/diheme cytochrome c family protein
MIKALALLLGCCLLAGGALTQAAAASPSSKDLVDRLGCLGCHSLKGQGRDRGPAWDGLGTRLTPEAIKKQILTPQGRMPSFAQIRPEELEALVDYLAALK